MKEHPEIIINGNVYESVQGEIYRNFGRFFVKWQQYNKCPKCGEPRIDLYKPEIAKGLVCTGCHTHFRLVELQER